MKSNILVFLQFFIIFLMILPIGAPTDTVGLGVAVFSFGLFIGFLAILKNKLGNFNVRPDIKEDCTLITTGIYAYIRHPMYTSVLIMMSSMMVIYPEKAEYLLYSILVVVLLLKMFYEESLWKCESEEYKEYTKSTKRVIPFIF
jgi:protein-S-isoprenylcysteine O-methyltransferase Ste14